MLDRQSATRAGPSIISTAAQPEDSLAQPSCILVEDCAPSAVFTRGSAERARWYAEQLERGNVLVFRQPPFALPVEDRKFLAAQEASESTIHKNVSYRPSEDKLRGFGDGATRERVHDIMRRYSRAVTGFIEQFLPYGAKYSLDYASFRPLEEQGRKLPLHKRNDLLHVDAFPSRPTRGSRILRAFTNIGTRPRMWNTTSTFPELASRLAVPAGLARYSGHRGAVVKSLSRLAAITGLAPNRDPYDRFMLHFHNWMKENREFQQSCEKVPMEFPPLSTWLVFTDGCPHAVLSGQYALEQTLIIALDALVCPEESPLRILEAAAGKSLL